MAVSACLKVAEAAACPQPERSVVRLGHGEDNVAGKPVIACIHFSDSAVFEAKQPVRRTDPYHAIALLENLCGPSSGAQREVPESFALEPVHRAIFGTHPKASVALTLPYRQHHVAAQAVTHRVSPHPAALITVQAVSQAFRCTIAWPATAHKLPSRARASDRTSAPANWFRAAKVVKLPP